MTTLIFSLFPSFTPVHAANLIVTSLADTEIVDGNCTLTEAIKNADNNAATNLDCAAGSGADIITFSVSGTIVLGSSLPIIHDTAGLTINGAGQSVAITGNDLYQLLVISVNASLTLENLAF
ncbi:MAG: hypothetical protein WA110_08590 [Anaerolineaceae bacterium]